MASDNLHTTTAAPEQLRLVLDTALAWKKYADGIEGRGPHPGEKEAFMKGFVAGRGKQNG
jgi:hypothetical protein